MPNKRIYIRAKAWRALLRTVAGDELEARRVIARMVHEKYGKETIQAA